MCIRDRVTVDGLGATYYLHAIILGSIVFSQYASISVGVIATEMCIRDRSYSYRMTLICGN